MTITQWAAETWNGDRREEGGPARLRSASKKLVCRVLAADVKAELAGDDATNIRRWPEPCWRNTKRTGQTLTRPLPLRCVSISCARTAELCWQVTRSLPGHNKRRQISTEALGKTGLKTHIFHVGLDIVSATASQVDKELRAPQPSKGSSCIIEALCKPRNL